MVRWMLFGLGLTACGSSGEMDKPNPPPNWYIEDNITEEPPAQKNEKETKKPKNETVENADPNATEVPSTPNGETQ